MHACAVVIGLAVGLIKLRPPVAVLQQRASIVVTGVSTRALDVRVLGASANGRRLPWTRLRAYGGVWHGTLPAPGLRGVYRLVLRAGPGTPTVRSRCILRVFEPGTLARPTFSTADDVARWWVTTIAGGRLVALRRWPLPDGDRRDPRLHQLVVVAYNLPGHPAVADRLGIFVTAVRDGESARWRLLEATIAPQ